MRDTFNIAWDIYQTLNQLEEMTHELKAGFLEMPEKDRTGALIDFINLDSKLTNGKVWRLFVNNEL